MLKKKTNRKQPEQTPLFEMEAGTANAFLELLSKTLDVNSAIKQLGLTKEQAVDILKSFIPAKPASGCVQKPEEFGPVTLERKTAKEQSRPATVPTQGIKKASCYINVDGASRGNPGRAGAGAVIKDLDGNVIRELKEYLGIATNNTAEYKALLLALTAVTEMGIKNVKVFADSELMVKQLNGVYKVKSEDLKPLYTKAIVLSKGFDSFEISHVYRENNSLADSLANEAIDSAVK